MNVKKEKLTHHAKVDRIDRITDILLTIGVGEPMYAQYNKWNDTTSYLTDTGVIIIRSGCNDVEGSIVTMYIATEEQAFAVAKSERLPTWLWRRIVKNNKKKKNK